jgi:hypothetical protein
MAFNDGEPIDAAQLGALETALAELKSKIPQLGSSTTSVSIDNRSFNNVVVPKIFGGKTATKPLTAGKTESFKINYKNAGFSANPTSITITPVRGTGMAAYEAYVVENSITTTEATINVYLPAGNTAKPTAFYFLAVQHS